MKNKKLKIIISIITLILSIMVTCLKSSAFNPEDYLYKDMGTYNIYLYNGTYYYKLTRADNFFNADNDEFYCIQMGPHMKAAYYAVREQIIITGNEAVSHDGTMSSNNIYNGILGYVLGKESEGPFGFVQAYINTEGNPDLTYTWRQRALWQGINTWIDENPEFTRVQGYKCSENESDSDTTALYTRAYNYANGGAGAAKIENNGVDNIVLSNNALAGPFNVKYSGNISSIEVKDPNGNALPRNQLKFYDANSREITDEKRIESESDFYVKSTTGKSIKSITVNVSSNDTIVTTISFLEAAWDPDFNQIIGGTGFQRIIRVERSTKETTDSVTIQTDLNRKLTVEKQDAESSTTLLDGAGFYITKDNKKWVGYDGTKVTIGNTKYKFLTGTSYCGVAAATGKFTLTNLPEGTYTAYEVQTPSSDYILEEQEHYDDDIKMVIGGSKKLEKDQSDTIVVKNKKNRTLTIQKKDADTGALLNNAGFKIKKDSQWLGYDGTKVTFVNAAGDAKEFLTGTSYCGVTAANGKITLTKLPAGTYKIYETKAPSSDYYLEYQEHYDSTNKWVYCGETQFADGREDTITVTNKKNVTIVLTKEDWDKTLRKNERGYNSQLDGFKFVIWERQKGWLGYDATNKKVTYDNVWRSTGNGTGAYMFETGTAYCGGDATAGTITLTNLRPGTESNGYYIFEVGTASPRDGQSNEILHYDLSLQKQYRTDSSVWTTFDGVVDSNGNSLRTKYEIPQGVEQALVNPRNEDNSRWVPYNRTSDSNEIKVDLSNRARTTIVINKTDKKTGNAIQGIGIKILVKANENNEDLGSSVGNWGWLKSKGTIKLDGVDYTRVEVTTDMSKATEFTTNASGKILITDNPYGTYYFYETKGVTGFDIKGQAGYNAEKPSGYTGTFLTGDYAYLGSQATNAKHGVRVLQFNAENRKQINISGYVWEDVAVGKNNLTNNKYDSWESKLEGITIYLKDRKETDETQYVKTVTTDEDGAYKLEGVYDDKLSDYYIEFDYSRTKYKIYIPVIIDDGANEDTSKALKYDLTNDKFPLKDSDLSGKATTYRGRPNTEDVNEGTYGLSYYYTTSLYKASTNTLEEINLGIKEPFDPEYRIEQDISYAKIDYDGHTYKYVYDGTEGRRELADSPCVAWEGKTIKGSYSREIYPSEIRASKAAMEGAEHQEKLKVYVVYRILIKNTSKYNDPDRYVEDKLYVTNLIENIDDKYELNTTDINEEYDSVTKSYFSKWGAASNGKTKYNATIPAIKSEGVVSIYIQFKVKASALYEILTNNPNEITAEVKAETTAYHTYYRNDYAWFANSDNENKLKKENQLHVTPVKPGYAIAPGMIFKLPENVERTVSGIVFKDANISTENEIIGNGKKEDGESPIEKVIVQIYSAKNGQIEKNADGTEKIAKRYTKDSDTPITEPLETTVDGTYEFCGVPPGEYVVRFTYGNTTYDIQKYKSTIVTLDSAKSALGNGTNTHKGEWYKYLKGNANTKVDSTNYSVAVDNLEVREQINDGEEPRPISIPANTPISDITIENTLGTQAKAITISETKTTGKVCYEDGQETTIVTDIKYNIKENNTMHAEFEGFNLGIIEAPIITTKLEKIITNVKLTNAQNNVLFEGNPQTEKNLRGVSSLGTISGKNGSIYTRIEMNNEEIYGSELEIQYKIIVTNVSKENYVETKKEKYGYYYLYGEKDLNDYSRPVQVNVDELIDYLDPTVDFISHSDGINLEKLTILGTTWHDENNQNYSITSNVNRMKETTGLKYEELLAVLRIKNIAISETRNFDVVTSRVLSSEDDDMLLQNDVEITKMSKAIGFKAGDNDEAKENANKSLKLVRQPVPPKPAEAIVTVTPPTGENRQEKTIYAIMGVVVLTASAVGILVIKRKIK